MRVATWSRRFGITFLVVVSLVLAFLTYGEYRPETIESVEIRGAGSKTLTTGEAVRVMTFNIGYGGLNEEKAYDLSLFGNGFVEEDVVLSNLEGIKGIMKDHISDLYLIQEADRDARRSHGINQPDLLHDHMRRDDYQRMYAPNFKAPFVPYPLSYRDHIGRIDSGLLTLSAFSAPSASRHAFDTDFLWPLSTVTFKRAMLITHIPIEGSERRLVVINIHLSPFDKDRSDAELDALGVFVKAAYENGDYVVVGGDFNRTFGGARDRFESIDDIPDAPVVSASRFGPAFRFVYDEQTPTKRSTNRPYDPQEEPIQHYLIDGFLVSDNITVIGVETLDMDFVYSDHNPVRLEFVLEP